MYQVEADEENGLPATTILGDVTSKVLDHLGYGFYPIGFDTAGNVGPTTNRLLRAVTRVPAAWPSVPGLTARVLAESPWLRCSDGGYQGVHCSVSSLHSRCSAFSRPAPDGSRPLFPVFVWGGWVRPDGAFPHPFYSLVP